MKEQPFKKQYLIYHSTSYCRIVVELIVKVNIKCIVHSLVSVLDKL